MKRSNPNRDRSSHRSRRRLAPKYVVPIGVLFACTVVMAQATPPSDRAQALIDKGLEYLKSQQKPDGGWQAEREPPGITAIVLRAFVQDPKYPANTDFVKRGYDKLLSYQLEDGGIYKDSLASYNTAIAISALTAANEIAYKDRIDKAVAYLKGLQWTDMVSSADGQKVGGKDDTWYGGWGYGGRSRGAGRPDLSNAQMALDALHDAGLKPDDPAFQAAIQFVSRLQNSSETNDQPWAGNDGGFVYGPSDNRKGESMAGEYTTADGHRRLRSYGSMTYAGLKSFIYAGLTKTDPRVRAAWDWITGNWTLDENPGMRQGDPERAQQGLYYYYHTLSRALNEYDEPLITDPQGNKHDWRVELIEKLASLQKPDGSWVGERRWMEDNPILVTAYTVLALQEVQKDLKEHPVEPNSNARQ
jgi:squalene-hopene/tetraprenyl-beta-curcumene cyclase